MVVGPEHEQRLRRDRTGHQVDRPRAVVVHPPPCRGHRVGFAADVHQGDRYLDRARQLRDLVAVDGEDRAERLRLGGDRSGRLHERRHHQGSAQVDRLGRGVPGSSAVEPLREPQRLLGGRETHRDHWHRHPRFTLSGTAFTTPGPRRRPGVHCSRW
ncbi:hypothetical protein Aglo01_48140 [Actinokineospora globicatena]|nr:hypothetical protein Aglo01_48140 [Actinokineospora globicatena]GLW87161.1 hypothetical protein Aglo02_48000 [Actinokineospora globicatena]